MASKQPKLLYQHDLFQPEPKTPEFIKVHSINDEVWLDNGVRMARVHLPAGVDIEASDVRRYLSPIIGEPSKPVRYWGVLGQRLRALGILIDTGRTAKSKARSNKGHSYPVYRRG